MRAVGLLGLAVMASAHPLNVQITATPDPAVPGARVLYTITVGNMSAQAIMKTETF